MDADEKYYESTEEIAEYKAQYKRQREKERKSGVKKEKG